MSPNSSPPLIGFGSRILKSPYFAATRRYGCQAYTIYHYTYMPLYYADPVTDYWSLVNDVTIWDVACERQLEITGPDAYQFVRLLTPRDLSQLAVGQAKYVLIVDENGGIINDPVLLRLGENHFWLSLADADVLLWAKGVALNSGLDVQLGEPDVSPLQVQGPKSADVIRTLFGEWILDLKYYHFRETELEGMPLVLARTGWSNELGYELFLRDGRYGDKLWEMVMAAGRPFNIAPSGPSNIKRLEAGLLSYRTDMWLEHNPYEMGLDWLIDTEQAFDFIGKEALKRIQSEGITRKRVGVFVEGEPITGNEHHWTVREGTQNIGLATSAVYSPRLEKNLGYAIVPVAYSEPGSRFIVETDDGAQEAVVTQLPFMKNRAK
jgi:aminomethyltransferase